MFTSARAWDGSLPVSDGLIPLSLPIREELPANCIMTVACKSLAYGVKTLSGSFPRSLAAPRAIGITARIRAYKGHVRTANFASASCLALIDCGSQSSLFATC